jgi:hypothetical protein
MKKTFLTLFILFPVLLAFNACNDPVFYMLSQEIKVAKPLIRGSATNFVVSGNHTYVASGSSLYRYNGGLDSQGRGNWTRDSGLPSAPGRRIMQLAVTDDYLYALCEGSNSRGVIKRATFPEPFQWQDLTGSFNNVQAIFAVNNLLFIGARNSNGSYSVYYEGNLNSPIPGGENLTILRGVAFNGANYFLCTADDLYYTPSPDLGLQLVPGDSRNYMGIINLGSSGGNRIFAIARNGDLFSVTTNGRSRRARFSDRRRATGTLAVWTNGIDNLLLAGRQDVSYSTSSGFTYGYVEISFDSSGITETLFRIPGEPGAVSTVINRNRYVNSIGKNPVNHLIQAPDGILLASTQKFGVWSLRYRGNDKSETWNAEE